MGIVLGFDKDRGWGRNFGVEMEAACPRFPTSPGVGVDE